MGNRSMWLVLVLRGAIILAVAVASISLVGLGLTNGALSPAPKVQLPFHVSQLSPILPIYPDAHQITRDQFSSVAGTYTSISYYTNADAQALWSFYSAWLTQTHWTVGYQLPEYNTVAYLWQKSADTLPFTLGLSLEVQGNAQTDQGAQATMVDVTIDRVADLSKVPLFPGAISVAHSLSVVRFDYYHPDPSNAPLLRPVNENDPLTDTHGTTVFTAPIPIAVVKGYYISVLLRQGCHSARLNILVTCRLQPSSLYPRC